MLFRKRKTEAEVAPAPEPKPTPAYLRDDYPYKAVGDPIEDLSTLEESGVTYEIWCDACQTSIRAQGKKLRETYEMLMAGIGCLGCGSKDLVVRRVDMGDLDVKRRERAAAASAAETAEGAGDAGVAETEEAAAE